jgi:hypothetical protein
MGRWMSEAVGPGFIPQQSNPHGSREKWLKKRSRYAAKAFRRTGSHEHALITTGR